MIKPMFKPIPPYLTPYTFVINRPWIVPPKLDQFRIILYLWRASPVLPIGYAVLRNSDLYRQSFLPALFDMISDSLRIFNELRWNLYHLLHSENSQRRYAPAASSIILTRMHLFTGNGVTVSEQNLRPLAGSYRSARRGDARAVQ